VILLSRSPVFDRIAPEKLSGPTFREWVMASACISIQGSTRARIPAGEYSIGDGGAEQAEPGSAVKRPAQGQEFLRTFLSVSVDLPGRRIFHLKPVRSSAGNGSRYRYAAELTGYAPTGPGAVQGPGHTCCTGSISRMMTGQRHVSYSNHSSRKGPSLTSALP
jgi:hypothetical protein